MKKISIIIVNYNSGDFLNRCLRSIISNVKVNYEVIVVDNESTDDSISRCSSLFSDPHCTLINSGGNLGFSKANNIGAKASEGEILHFLNPDTLLHPDINRDYEEVMESSQYVYVNDLQNLDGTFVQSKNLIPTIKNYFLRCLNRNACQYWYTGATVIISKENFEKIGRWNDNYFMYSEDLDLFFKINKCGLLIRKLSSIIIHVGGVSSSRTWANYEREKIKIKSLKKFYKLNDIAWQFRIIACLLIIYTYFKDKDYSRILFKIMREKL